VRVPIQTIFYCPNLRSQGDERETRKGKRKRGNGLEQGRVEHGESEEIWEMRGRWEQEYKKEIEKWKGNGECGGRGGEGRGGEERRGEGRRGEDGEESEGRLTKNFLVHGQSEHVIRHSKFQQRVPSE
jgi:hypothetical protein